MSGDIFISFASQDRRVAMTLCSALENRGFRCWISARDIPPGENFQSAIVQAIRRAKIMLLVFTANSNNSNEMSKELALASQANLMVVPLRIEDVAPNDAFAYEFATRQWIDFFADWEFAVQQLATRIEVAIQGPAAAEVELVANVTAPAVSDALSGAAETVTVADLEPRSFAAEESRGAAMEDFEGPEAPPVRSRRRAYVLGLSALVAITAVIGVVGSNLMRAKPPKSEMRAMEVLRPQAPPVDLQRVSVEGPAGPEPVADATPAVVTSKHKKPKAKVDDDVPY